jgi:hypothetical protein
MHYKNGFQAPPICEHVTIIIALYEWLSDSSSSLRHTKIVTVILVTCSQIGGARKPFL